MAIIMDETRVEKAIDKLYNVNAAISAVTYIKKEIPTLKTMQDLNSVLGDIIKELREGYAKDIEDVRKQVLDEVGVVHGKDAEKFIENMERADKNQPTIRDIELAKEIIKKKI